MLTLLEGFFLSFWEKWIIKECACVHIYMNESIVLFATVENEQFSSIGNVLSILLKIYV